MDDLALPGRDDGLWPDGDDDLNGPQNLQSTTEHPPRQSPGRVFCCLFARGGGEEFSPEDMMFDMGIGGLRKGRKLC